MSKFINTSAAQGQLGTSSTTSSSSSQQFQPIRVGALPVDSHANATYTPPLRWKSLQQGTQVVPATIAPAGVPDAGFAVFNAAYPSSTFTANKRRGSRKKLPVRAYGHVQVRCVFHSSPVSLDNNAPPQQCRNDGGPEAPRFAPEADGATVQTTGPQTPRFNAPLIHHADVGTHHQAHSISRAPLVSPDANTSSDQSSNSRGPEILRTYNTIVPTPQFHNSSLMRHTDFVGTSAKKMIDSEIGEESSEEAIGDEMKEWLTDDFFASLT